MIYAWIGNFWIVVGTLLLPRHMRAAVACFLAGNVAWFAYGVMQEDAALVALNVFLCAVNGRNWYEHD